MQTSFDAFKAANEQGLKEIAKFGDMLGETKAAIDKINSKIDGHEDAIAKREAKDEAESRHQKVLSAIAEIEAKINRKGGVLPGNDEESKAKEFKKFFFKLMRSGLPVEAIEATISGGKFGALPEGYKVLHSGSDTQGGYLVPLEYVQEIIANIVEFSPLRQICTARSTTRQGVQVPKKTGTASASWVEDLGTRTETTNPSFGMFELKSHEMYAMTKVAKTELEDAVFDLEAFLRADFAEQFGVLEGAGFVSGSGVGRPEGVLTNSSITSVNSGHASEIKADGLIALYYELKEAYLSDAYFVLSRSTLKTIRQLKDSAGNYLWAAGIKTDARPATILDKPYLTCIDMPDIGANTYPVAFGSFRRGYMILDRVNMEFQVDPITSKATGMVEFSARKRVGGAVILPEAIKKLKISA
jgi:HK97 family phage major capsid protein